MAQPAPSKETILDSIRKLATTLGKVPSRSEFVAATGITEHNVLKYFAGWRDAVSRAGLSPHSANTKLDDSQLFEDWAALVRKCRHIPTRDQYRRQGSFSPSAFEKHFGPWSAVPARFREYANGKGQWDDVVALLPLSDSKETEISVAKLNPPEISIGFSAKPGFRYAQRGGRPTYGNPIDFRGLRHEPVNEQGVVFLFGMVARELGYMVEAVQTGFPDCEAKRQVSANKWQRIRIEFEFESRNFRDHGHSADACDIIICWRHNWLDCPAQLEVLELGTVIKSLSNIED